MNGLLFDENVPTRISIPTRYPIKHVNDLGKGLKDTEIWNLAQINEYTIVTKDTDFSNRIIVSKPPPWIVHLKFGNMRSRDFHAFLSKVWPQIEELLPNNKLVTVFPDRIEAIS